MKALPALLLSSAVLLPFTTHAESAHPGEQRINKDCQQCHDNSIFSRPNSILHSFDDLVGRVNFCENASGHSWTDKQRQEVIDYLNETYYHFPAHSK